MQRNEDADPWRLETQPFDPKDYLRKRDIPFVLHDSFKTGLLRHGLKLSWKIWLK